MLFKSNGHRYLSLFACLLVLMSICAGCSDDDPVAPSGGQQNTSTTGFVAISCQPDYLNIDWALTQPSGATVQGQGNAFMEDMALGTYQVSWPDYSGWIAPHPNPRGKELAGGRVLEFYGNYYPLPGNIIIQTDPPGVPASWSLDFEDEVVASSQGDTTLVRMIPGEYRMIWQPLEGWVFPDHVDTIPAYPDTSYLELDSNLGLFIAGPYEQNNDSFFISSQPSELAAPWSVTGPGGFDVAGEGNQTVAFTSGGEYTITWGDVSDFTTPSAETFVVEANMYTQVSATYFPITGTITVNANRGSSSLMWTLEGPGNYSLTSSGDRELTGLAFGEYTISWPEMADWSSPDPSSQVLDPGGSLVFTQNHQPALSLGTQPEGLLAPWQVTGPGGYQESGTGVAKLTGLAAGSYTVTWQAFTGWTVPAAQTGTLSTDQGVIVEGSFVQNSQTVFIAPEPVGTEAPWVLTGPNGFSQSGTGQLAVSIVDLGEYRLTWGAMDGLVRPGLMIQLVIDEASTTFTGRYLPTFEMIGVTAETFEMGSPINEGCRQFGEVLHEVTLTNNFSIQATEVTNAQYKDLAQWAIDNGYATLGPWALFDALDHSTALLLHLGDGDQDIYIEDGKLACRNPDYPVKKVSWYGAVAYCDWLSLHRGTPRAYSHDTWQCNDFSPVGAVGFRLPTEPEWEMAARAGTTTAFANGPIFSFQGNCSAPDLDLIGWWAENANAWSHPVAQLDPNDWGIYDMHGNLGEWCNDWFVPGYYNISPEENPPGPSTGETKVVRGGYFYSPVEECRSAARDEVAPANVSYNVGFRVAQTSGR